ncbi:MAG: hypothetical protein CM15mP10_1080 [Actinomycetota bacterium]|nr:MAG: hypothetical protein CM15mP10_1080 [Actinomycetota bacterium]
MYKKCLSAKYQEVFGYIIILQTSPCYKRFASSKNEDAIKRSVQNLVRTKIGEVFFRNDIGTRITGALFELGNSDFIDPISTEIDTVITNFEPRVNLTDVSVESRPDENSLDIEISYNIVGLSLPTQTINFILEPTRL